MSTAYSFFLKIYSSCWNGGYQTAEGKERPRETLLQDQERRGGSWTARGKREPEVENQRSYSTLSQKKVYGLRHSLGCLFCLDINSSKVLGGRRKFLKVN